MAFPVSPRSTGDLVTAAIWNADIKDNMNTLRAGGIATSGQAAEDFVIATSSTQLDTLSQLDVIMMMEVYL